MIPEYVTPPFLDYFIGLDLGKVADFTAAAVLERSGSPGAHRYDVVALERTRGRMYTQVIAAVQAMVADPALRVRRLVPADGRGRERLEPAPPPTLVLDSTGVGSPVTDQFLAAPLAAAAVPIVITGGSTWRRDRWPGKASVSAYWVAKSVLVSVVQVLLQAERLRVVPTLPLAGVLEDELLNFEVKVSEAANESYGCWRSNKHDDLVLAIALGCFVGELRPVVRTVMRGKNPLEGYRG